MLRRGRCFALSYWASTPIGTSIFSNCPTLLFLYKLTVGRVKLNFLKMKKSMFTAFAVGLCLSANVMAQVPSYVPTNGLVGWWPFNGNANDESGNGNNGTVNGATLTTDRNGVANKAYSFDGVNDYILLANSGAISFSNGISFSAWVKTQDIRNSSIVDKETNCVSYGYRISTRNNGDFWAEHSCYGNGQPGAYGAIANSNYSTNTWYFIVGTLDLLSGNSIYINGNIVDNGTVSQLINNLKNIEFGRSTLIQGEYFFGTMDDIGIWNRALTECEVADIYNSQLGSFSNSSVSINPSLSSLGSNATLTVTTPIQNIQWLSNPSNIGWVNLTDNSNYNGVNNDTLVVSNVQLSNHDQPFRVLACGDTSNIANIQIADTCITNVTVYDTLLTTVTDTLIINTTLSLPAPNNENTILIYPNPASDHITIDNGNYTAMTGYTIKIENNAGQQVFQSLINQAQFYVDLSTWSGNGLYFVHLIDAQGNTVTVRKIVLQ